MEDIHLGKSQLANSGGKGKRHAHGAILKLLNIVNQHGIKALI